MCCVVAGRNIHALDPYRMPSQAALERGSAVAQGIIDSHMQANGGAYPETVAVCLYPGPNPAGSPTLRLCPVPVYAIFACMSGSTTAGHKI